MQLVHQWFQAKVLCVFPLNFNWLIVNRFASYETVIMITSYLEKIVSRKDVFASSIGSKTRRNTPPQPRCMENSDDCFGPIVVYNHHTHDSFCESIHNSIDNKAHTLEREHTHTHTQIISYCAIIKLCCEGFTNNKS